MDAELFKEIGARVHDARKRLGYSQVVLAEMTQLHPTYISQIENGKANMSVDVLKRISEALQVSCDWLLQSEIPAVADIQDQEIIEILSDCSLSERKSILKMVRELKIALRSK